MLVDTKYWSSNFEKWLKNIFRTKSCEKTLKWCTFCFILILMGARPAFLGMSPKILFFASFCVIFASKSFKHIHKTEKGDFYQCLECTVLTFWLKYTPNNFTKTFADVKIFLFSVAFLPFWTIQHL